MKEKRYSENQLLEFQDPSTGATISVLRKAYDSIMKKTTVTYTAVQNGKLVINYIPRGIHTGNGEMVLNNIKHLKK